MKKSLRKILALALVMMCAMNVSAASDVILAANFDDGSSPFGGWGNNSTLTVTDGVLVINNPSVVNPWEAQMAYDASYKDGATYTLKFRIKGSDSGSISANFQVTDDNYKDVGNFGDMYFDAEWKDIKKSVQCSSKGANRLCFSFGQFAGDIYIDDFELIEETEGTASGANPDIRWSNILTNSDLEGEENVSFVSKENDPAMTDESGNFLVLNSTITDGVGVDGSRGIKVRSLAGAVNDWDSQFWIVAPEVLPAGTEYRVSFDYCASRDVTVSTQAHANPSEYIHYEMIGSPAFTLNWQHFEKEGVISASQAGDPNTFRSIAFNLSIDKENDVDFYFDNIKFEVYSYSTVAEYCNGIVKLDFGYKTNVADLVNVTGKRRLVYPTECATVKYDGEEVPIISVEAFADGRFYIFVDEILDEDVEVEVTFTNPINPAYRVVYVEGEGGDVPDFLGMGYYNPAIEVDDAVPGEYAVPEVLTTDPENGAFNLPNTIREFKVVFERPIRCAELRATLAGEKLSVSPSEGLAEEVILSRTGTSELADGQYEIALSNIAPENEIGKDFWGKASFVINIGHDISGFDEVKELVAALDIAKGRLIACEDPIYAGNAYDYLVEVIALYESSYPTFTSPTAFKNAIATVNAAVQGMNSHASLCDSYYATVESAIASVAAYGESKFASMPMFVELKESLAQYLAEDGSPLKLIDDAQLQAAVDALKSTTDNLSKLFTEGKSDMANTGIKVLVERLRLGAEVLKDLGVSDNDELVLKAYNALTDDDNIADQLMKRVKLELYGQLKNPENKLFKETVDESTGETVTESYDMTVFVKNPNIYNTQTTVNRDRFVSESVPGWIVPDSVSVPGISWGWDSDPASDVMDCQFQTWGYSYCIEQTVVDLPAGIYTVKAGFGERQSEADAPDALTDSYFYVKTSSTPEGELGDTITAPRIGQTFPSLNVQIQNVLVTDGKLTVGVHAGPASHTFFNDVQLLISGSAEGFDYSAAYNEAVQGIGLTEAAPAQVIGIELYDLNGRRVNKASDGIFIMRKFMSDGTVRVEKIIKK